jgi:hypothetical protein
VRLEANIITTAIYLRGAKGNGEKHNASSIILQGGNQALLSRKGSGGKRNTSSIFLQ